jgi:hypothetical protein
VSVLDLTEYEYHADQVDNDRPSASRSILQIIDQKTPAHAKAAHPRLNPDWMPQQKKSFDVGHTAHELLLYGEANVAILGGYADWKKPKAREEAVLARSYGRIPLLQHEWDQVRSMMTAVREQIDARDDEPPLFTDGDHEVTLAWEENGVLCRARLDWLSADRRTVDDFKTSSNAEPFRFSRGSFFDYGYDLQAAFYQRAVRACFGVDPVFRLAVVEKEPPHSLIVFDAAPDVLELANAKLDWALGVWARCLDTGEWPGYPCRTHSVTLPPWAEEQWFKRFEGVAA